MADHFDRCTSVLRPGAPCDCMRGKISALMESGEYYTVRYQLEDAWKHAEGSDNGEIEELRSKVSALHDACLKLADAVQILERLVDKDVSREFSTLISKG